MNRSRSQTSQKTDIKKSQFPSMKYSRTKTLTKPVNQTTFIPTQWSNRSVGRTTRQHPTNAPWTPQRSQKMGRKQMSVHYYKKVMNTQSQTTALSAQPASAARYSSTSLLAAGWANWKGTLPSTANSMVQSTQQLREPAYRAHNSHICLPRQRKRSRCPGTRLLLGFSPSEPLQACGATLCCIL